MYFWNKAFFNIALHVFHTKFATWNLVVQLNLNPSSNSIKTTTELFQGVVHKTFSLNTWRH